MFRLGGMHSYNWLCSLNSVCFYLLPLELATLLKDDSYSHTNWCVFQTRFIMGFFIAVFPWYIGAGIFLFVRHDVRERTGLLACTIAVSPVTFSTVDFSFSQICCWVNERDMLNGWRIASGHVGWCFKTGFSRVQATNRVRTIVMCRH